MEDLNANNNIQKLYTSICSIINKARSNAYKAINFAMVVSYWSIGQQIVEDEQQGNTRAEYGKAVLKELSKKLTAEYGKGYDESNLRYMRLFYQTFPICDTLRHELTWSHYKMLLRVKDKTARIWYMNEAAEQTWSTRQLDRQISVLYYERLLASQDKKSVKTVLNEKTPQENAEDAAKVLDIAAENASEMVSVSEIPATEISEAVEDVADVSAVAQAKTDSKNAIPEQPISVQEPEVSEEGETLIASAVENLKNADESEAGENGQADFSQKQTAQTAKTETAKKGASLTVHDERTEKVADVSVQKTAAEGAEIKAVSENAVEMTMANVTTANITSSNSQTASAVGSNYQSMLANQIQNNAPEFVKAGSIVLRDNNQGTINLILHPESLGNVKVSLQLTDKVIAGQIVVQSQEAYNAFRDSIDSLKQAFAQNGFDTANFNLAMGGDMMNGNGGNHEGRADAPFVANRAYGDYAESADMAASSLADYAGGTDGVDIVA